MKDVIKGLEIFCTFLTYVLVVEGIFQGYIGDDLGAISTFLFIIVIQTLDINKTNQEALDRIKEKDNDSKSR